MHSPALPLTGAAAPAAAPSDLALSCDWAIRQADYISTTAHVESWSDEKLGHECARYNEGMERALAQPSSGLAEIQAKARLALHDLEAEGVLENANQNLRLAVTA